MLINLSSQNNRLFATSHAIATTQYICRKKYSEGEIRTILDYLLEMITIIAVDADVLKKSLKSSHNDFEDAVQIFCAHKIKNLDGIITRNLKNLPTAETNVFSPDQALLLLNQN